MMDKVPADIRYDINSKFIQLDTTHEGNNPIERVEVVASQQNGVVTFEEIPLELREAGVDGNGGGVGGGVGAGGAGGRANEVWKNVMYAKLANTQTVVKEIHNFLVLKLADLEKKMKRLDSNMRTLTTAPARRVGVVGVTGRAAGGRAVAVGATPDAGRPAVLCSTPRTLYVLWDEYQNGIGGSKPARQFTPSERGRCKHKYSDRKVAWKCIERLLDRGYNLGESIRRIHSVYGHTSITKIIAAMKKDERRGGHANLR